MAGKTFEEIEFGDFQTPDNLASTVCEVLKAADIQPLSVIEPTCGQGNLLLRALETFPNIKQAVGLDVSPLYVATVRSRLQSRPYAEQVKVFENDFFHTDWARIIDDLPEPILVIGNPPWVTSAQIGALAGANLPVKSNFQKHSGLDAKMGKSNFDISEWMLIKCLHWLDGRNAVMAMLCKTAVARKLLAHCWKNSISLSSSAIYHIDALKHFGASVDACLFVCHFAPASNNYDASLYIDLAATEAVRIIGYRDDELVSKVALYDRWKHLKGQEVYKWRSGIKHDCSKIMELTKEGVGYKNGLGQVVELEDSYLYPMLKTSQVANSSSVPNRLMIVPQKFVGEDTASIKDAAPLTWDYLNKNSNLLDRRGSVIYKNRPRFSVFGIGDYSFALWKVAISGFYKRLQFKTIGPVNGRPVVLDDASYFVACQLEEEANLVARLLNSKPAAEFFESFVFWDSKRPITVDLLRKLDLLAVARELGLEYELKAFIPDEATKPEPKKKRRSAVNVDQLTMI